MDIKELSKHTFIVFGEEHYNPLGVIRSLGEKGLKPIFITINGQPHLASCSRYLSKVYRFPKREEALDFIIKNYKGNKYKPFIYVCDDTTMSLLDMNYDSLKEDFYFFNAGSKGALDKFLNKKNIVNLAQEFRLNILTCWEVNNGNIPNDISYPIITKAIDSKESNWKKSVFICNNEKELLEAFHKIESNKILIQKYLKKKNEYCIDGISFNNGNDIYISIEATYEYILEDTYSLYMNVRPFSNKQNVLDPLKKMFKKIRFEGVFCIEFLIGEDNTLYFTEINFRNSGWSYASTCAGMNLPFLWAVSMLTDTMPINLIENNEEREFKAIVEFADFRERVLKRRYPFNKWMIDFWNSKCKFYIGRNDTLAIFRIIINKLIFKITN